MVTLYSESLRTRGCHSLCHMYLDFTENNVVSYLLQTSWTSCSSNFNISGSESPILMESWYFSACYQTKQHIWKSFRLALIPRTSATFVSDNFLHVDFTVGRIKDIKYIFWGSKMLFLHKIVFKSKFTLQVKISKCFKWLHVYFMFCSYYHRIKGEKISSFGLSLLEFYMKWDSK